MMSDRPESSSYSSNITQLRQVIAAITLQSEIKQLEAVDEHDTVLMGRRSILTNNLTVTLRDLRKDDISAKQLGDVSEEDSDSEDDDEPVIDHSDVDEYDDGSYDAAYDYLYDMYYDM